MKCRFTIENTPKIEFECQEGKQLSNILELYFKIFQVRTIFFFQMLDGFL